MHNKRVNRLLVGAAVTVFWVTVWAMLSGNIGEEILLPSPIKVMQTLWAMWCSSTFWNSVAMSLLRILCGFIAAVIAGTLLAILTTRFRALHALLSPLLSIVRAAPVASFIILAYVWIRVQILPAFIAFLMVLPLVWANVSEGIGNTDKKLIETAYVFRLGRWKTFRLVHLPSIRPYFTVACTTGLGFAWKSGIAAEVICTPANSIGKQLYSAKAYLETPEVFAWTVTVVLLSVVLEQVLLQAVKRRKAVSG